METGGHPSQSRYDFDICIALLFPVLLLPVRNRRRQRQMESVPFRFSFGLGNTRQGAARICRSCSVRINLPLGKKRFRLPQEVPSRHRYRHVWFGCRLLVRAGSLAGREFAFIVLRENLPTLAGGEPSHPHPFYWYLPVFLRHTAPWSLFFLPMSIFPFRFRHRLFEEKLLYFVVWLATVLIFFLWFTQKRSVYILSIYPAMALLLGAWIQKLKTEPSLPGLMLARLMGYLCGASFLLFAALLLIEVTGLDLFRNFYPIHDIKERAQLALIVNLL